MSTGRRLDLHVHSSYSPDSRIDLGRALPRLGSLGLDGFALTDHNSIAGHRRLAEIARAHPELRLLPGVEVSTADGHLLALGVEEAPPPGRSLEETAEWTRARGGVPVPSHPFRRPHGAGGKVAARAKVPALEVLNGHDRAGTDRRATALARELGLGATGGSDAHRLEELGRAWTVFPADADSIDDLLEAIRRGATIAGGRSATFGEGWSVAIRSFALRLGRGLRPI
jgi:predicted metal-dependent phosphoesterase TrpH